MADGPGTALQKALIDSLKASAEVSAIVGARIYDQPPQAVAFPYIRIGAIEPRPVRTTCGKAYIVTFGIEGYSRPKSGRVEATRIAEAIERALDDQELLVDGFSVTYVFFRTQTVARDADGKSYTSISAFDTLLDVA